MKTYFRLSLSVVLIFCGCQSRHTVALASVKSASANASAHDQNPGPAPSGSVGGLRENGSIEVFGMNRYIDPADSRIMHERHAIYRLEQRPAWLLRSPRDQNEVILGPIAGLKRAEYAPEPLPGETSREMMCARRGVEQANDSIKAMRDGQERLANSVERLAKETADAERKLTSVVSILNERIKHLEVDNGIVHDDRAQGAQIESPDGGAVARPSNP
jgi:hypothetical protein